MTGRRDYPAPPPELPTPVFAHQRPSPPVAVLEDPTPRPPSLADECVAAALEGALWEDFEVPPGLVQQVTRTGPFTRPGVSGPAAVVVSVDLQLPRRIVAEVVQPGRRFDDRVWLEPSLGEAADISSTRVMEFIEQTVDGADALLPKIIIIGPGVQPPRITPAEHARLKKLAEHGRLVILVRS